MLKLLLGLSVVRFLLITSPPAAGFQIRLAGSGSNQCSGRVEIYHNTWGTVCDDAWDLKDAMVVCRQLNCGTALSAPHSAHFGQGEGSIWLDDVGCSGSELSLTTCRHRPVGQHDCSHPEDAGVVCSGFPIRLAGSGSNRCSGRVEIYHNTWGTICDDGWDLNDAMVVCRELNCGTAVSAPQSAHFGQGVGSIWLDDVGCSGSELSVTTCHHNPVGDHNCGHQEDAGVVCSALLKPDISMNRPGELTWGQNIGITCSIAANYRGGRFLFTHTPSQIAKFNSTSSSTSATFNVTQVTFNDEGQYQCQFQTEVSGQLFKSLFSDNVILSVTVNLPKPCIFMNPPVEVTWGQDVVFNCSITTQHLGGTFTLQHRSGSGSPQRRSSSPNSATFSIHQVNLDQAGLYQCQYRTSVSSRQVNSPPSDSVNLSVTVNLPKPRIFMHPPVEVTWGQDVVFNCSITTQHLGGTFTLQHRSGSGSPQRQSSSPNSATFSIHQVNLDQAGLYQCQYRTSVSSRHFNSPPSDSVNLSVTVPQLQPTISLMSAGRGLHWSPEAAEVTKGYSFVINCSISSHLPEGVFSLFFCGSNTTDIKPAVNYSASFEFPVAEYKHQGNYSCVYEVTLSSRTFCGETTSISVIVKLSLLLLVSSVATGSLVLLLLVLVVICLVCKRRSKAMPPRVLQLAVMNDYEDPEDEVEQLYEDFERVESKERQLEQASEHSRIKPVDAEMAVMNDYEDHEDEVEQLYENFERVESKERQLEQASGLVDEDHDDYEREKNNTGHGCVQNPFVEDWLDIYGDVEDGDVEDGDVEDGDVEDIYQNI